MAGRRSLKSFTPEVYALVETRARRVVGAIGRRWRLSDSDVEEMVSRAVVEAATDCWPRWRRHIQPRFDLFAAGPMYLRAMEYLDENTRPMRIPTKIARKMRRRTPAKLRRFGYATDDATQTALANLAAPDEQAPGRGGKMLARLDDLAAEHVEVAALVAIERGEPKMAVCRRLGLWHVKLPETLERAREIVRTDAALIGLSNASESDLVPDETPDPGPRFFVVTAPPAHLPWRTQIDVLPERRHGAQQGAPLDRFGSRLTVPLYPSAIPAVRSPAGARASPS